MVAVAGERVKPSHNARLGAIVDTRIKSGASRKRCHRSAWDAACRVPGKGYRRWGCIRKLCVADLENA